MERLKFAIVGCGKIADRHAEQISDLAQLKAVCDIVEARAVNLGKKYGTKPYTDYDKMLSEEKDIDVISVCSPNGLHAKHSVKAFRKGFHVVCEKPMAISVFDCGEMIKEAEKANRRLFVVKQNRYNPPVVALKQALEDNRLGKILSVQLNCFWNRNPEYYSQSDWKGTLKLDGGTLFTQFSHFIDLLYWMLGDVKHCHAYTRNLNHKDQIEFEDCGVVILEFFNGVIGTINFTINSFNKNMEGSLTVFGESGTVKIGGQYLNELEYQNIKDYRISDLPPGNPPNNYGQYTGSMSNHNMVYRNVIDVLKNNGIIGTNGFEGLKTVEIIDKIYSASRSIL
ncbi:MAG: Gfo/Idh/MocA family oxidoreductase [Bacteroidales bacterium]|jgi:predicted dehydrogenase|nr:Gfo/Idh/MocA family oxidoreductase [Bacteroidales bacterium]